MDISDLGACLRALRRRADLSQRELAQRAGIPPSTVSRLESGDVLNPRLQTLRRIAEAADCELMISPKATTESTSGSQAPDSIKSAATRLEPVPDDHVADQRGRRYPAHLDGSDDIFGTAWNRTVRDARDDAVAHLAAQVWPPLSHWPGRPADAIVGGLAVESGWRGIGIEEKLLGALRDEIAGRDFSEVVMIGTAWETRLAF